MISHIFFHIFALFLRNLALQPGTFCVSFSPIMPKNAHTAGVTA